MYSKWKERRQLDTELNRVQSVKKGERMKSRVEERGTYVPRVEKGGIDPTRTDFIRSFHRRRETRLRCSQKNNG